MRSELTDKKFRHFLEETINVNEMILSGASKNMNENGTTNARLSAGDSEGSIWFRAD